MGFSFADMFFEINGKRRSARTHSGLLPGRFEDIEGGKLDMQLAKGGQGVDGGVISFAQGGEAAAIGFDKRPDRHRPFEVGDKIAILSGHVLAHFV